jgi:glycosyltransferase involved in cell wall biosynthesis
MTLTDGKAWNHSNSGTFGSQIKLFCDFLRRCRNTMRVLDLIRDDDIAYSMSDYWFDTVPMIGCRARRKILYLGMVAPTIGEVITRGRPDVPKSRLSALYYRLSQENSLSSFRMCFGGHVTYSHPDMREYVQSYGYPVDRMHYVPNGADVRCANSVPAQKKVYDVAWIGRPHAQKGIQDLLTTLVWCKQRLPDFNAVLIGRCDALRQQVRMLGLDKSVTFAGVVSQDEKFRLLKSSRVFVMPSHYESWGIVLGEALVSGVACVAYDLDCYRPVFGNYVRVVPCFGLQEFKRTVEEEVLRQRNGQNYLAALGLDTLKEAIDWKRSEERFQNLLCQLSSEKC